ncbi:hypothetical protein EV714DRAFT_267157 [Schizophyllum commune]
MTQLPQDAGLPANVTPAQLQAIMLYLAQNQVQLPGPSGQPPTSPSSSTLSSLSSLSDTSSNSVGPGGPSPSSGPGGPLPLAGPGIPPQPVSGDTGIGAPVEPPSRLKTPPPILRPSSPPPTPRTPANRKSRLGKVAASASLTPSSKLAQLTLDGEKASPSSSSRNTRSRAKTAQPKPPLPTGHDPALTFEEPMAVDATPLPAQTSGSVQASTADDQGKSDPFEGFPEIVSGPPKPTASDSNPATEASVAAETSAATEANVSADANDPAGEDMEVDPPARVRSSRSRPTTKRQINTRRTRSHPESSPPPTVKRSPKKKVRVRSPAHSPTRARASSKKKSGRKSPTPADDQPSSVPASSHAEAGPSETAHVSEAAEAPKVDEDAVRTVEGWLEQLKQGRPLTEIGIMFNNAAPSPIVREEANNQGPSVCDQAERSARSHFIDDEAEEESVGQVGEDEGEDLDGFIVPDNVVEYDGDAPALPDDDDHSGGDAGDDHGDDDDDDDDDDKPLTFKRLHRRSSATKPSRDDANESEVEIVNKADKGKGRAVPLSTPLLSKSVAPSAASVSTSAGTSSNPSQGTRSTKLSGAIADNAGSASNAAGTSGNLAVSGSKSAPKEPAWAALKSVTTLYPGSLAVDASANVCPRLQLNETPFTYATLNYELLQSINFAAGVKPVPSDCAFISDFIPDGYGNPNVDLVAAAETNIHRKNLIAGLMIRRQGCFINDATVDPAEIMAVQVSPAGSTLRYKSVLADTRAPAVSITPGVIREWSLDTPTNNAHPIRFLTMTLLEALVDRFIAAQCMNFGQRELTVNTLANAIRFATVPAFGRPTHPVAPASSTLSSSMRRNNAGPSMRRSVNFEPTTNDPIAILDARHTKLPDDIGLWTTVLPRFEGPLPNNAVAFVAHTTSMWVGTRSTTAPSGMTYNIQHNLVFVVIIGELPAGYV